MFEAAVDFKSPGLYNSVSATAVEDKTKVARGAMAIDFDLHSIPFYAEDVNFRDLLPPPKLEETYRWANRMVEKGVSGEDIQFLAKVLNPHPDAWLTTQEIIESGHLEI